MRHSKENIPFLAAPAGELGAKDLVLDLKTEGRFWRTSRITGLFLISRENSGIVEEVFLPEKESDEYDLLAEAARRLEGPGALVTYNGDTFALPHLRKKYEAYRLPVPFERRTSVDLLKKIRCAQKLFDFPSRKLADVSGYLAHSVSLQNGAAITDSSVFANDARRTFAVLSFLPILRFLDGSFSVDSVALDGSKLLFSLKCIDDLPFSFSVSEENISLEVLKEGALLSMPVENSNVRKYFQDYKNYEYLPMEGYAVHKSVSAFIAKDRKEPATLRTSFIPVPVKKLLEDPDSRKSLAKSAVLFLRAVKEK